MKEQEQHRNGNASHREQYYKSIPKSSKAGGIIVEQILVIGFSLLAFGTKEFLPGKSASSNSHPTLDIFPARFLRGYTNFDDRLECAIAVKPGFDEVFKPTIFLGSLSW